MQEINIHVNARTILKIIGIILLCYVFYLVKDIIFLLLVAIMLALVIDPLVTWLHKKKIPRLLSVLTVYTFLLSLVIILVALFTPILTRDLPQLVANVGNYLVEFQTTTLWHKLAEGVLSIQNTLQNYGFDFDSNQVVTTTNSSGAFYQVLSTITGFLGGFFSLILVLVVTFYMVVEKESLKKTVYFFIPEEHLERVVSITRKIRVKLAAWLKGQLLISLMVGFLVFFGLMLLNFKYAILLGLIAAILEFIPYVGPVFASVPAIILALSQGGSIQVLLVLLVYVVAHELEVNLFIPKVMHKIVGINPIISIISILAGFNLAGVLGALIAIPVATALSVLIQDVLAKEKNN